jgi:hypothetical protein
MEEDGPVFRRRWDLRSGGCVCVYVCVEDAPNMALRAQIQALARKEGLE